MTEWHINDLSLSGQFKTPKEFCVKLLALLKLRSSNEALRAQLYCSRQISTRPVTQNMDLRNAVLQHGDRKLTAQVLGWLNKSGPYWDDDRDGDDLARYMYAACDVTDQGLGEAARRRERGIDAQTLSFDGATPSSSMTPLTVIQQPTGGIPQTVMVPNLWDIAALEHAVQTVPLPPRNWDDAVARLRVDFNKVLIAPWVEDDLRPHPFNMNVYGRARELLGVLQQFVESHDAHGLRTAATQRIISVHFAGKKAWFTDSSTTEKNNFKEELTFKDPENPKVKILCGWHGKIKSLQYRVHFDWPLTASQKVVKVVYIGPKLTKS